MSEPIPESIPTSADPRSRRPVKKSRPNPASDNNALTSEVANLFSDPTRAPITLPPTSRDLAESRARASANAVPEIVANVQGSSAGAGSGEFHVYKASRRREYERVRRMEEEVETEERDRVWEEQKRERERVEEEKREKNRKKREKKKQKGKGMEKGGNKDGKEDIDVDGDDDSGRGAGKENGKKASTANGKIGPGLSQQKLRNKAVDYATNETDGLDEDAHEEANGHEVGVIIHDDD